MPFGLGWPELSVILLIVIVLFGWKKLPEISRSVGRSARIFKSEVDEMKRDGRSDAANATVKGETVAKDEDLPRPMDEEARHAADVDRQAAERRAEQAQRELDERRATDERIAEAERRAEQAEARAAAAQRDADRLRASSDHHGTPPPSDPTL